MFSIPYLLLSAALGLMSGTVWWIATGSLHMPFLVLIGMSVGCALVADLIENVMERRASGRIRREAGGPRHRKKVV